MNRPALAALVIAAAFSVDARAQPAKPEAHETSVDGVTVEVTEAVRREGVLTVKLRFRNTKQKPASFYVVPDGNWNAYYLVSGKSKLMVLKDSKDIPMMPPLGTGNFHSRNLEPGASYLFWAKFPAPPADVKKVDIHTPLAAPIEGVAIAEAK